MREWGCWLDAYVVNDLIRKARHQNEEIEAIRAKLIRAEQSGYSDRTPEDIRKDVLARRKKMPKCTLVLSKEADQDLDNLYEEGIIKWGRLKLINTLMQF